jgi:beta-glucosidase
MKEKKSLLAWIGIGLALLAAVLYAVFYGKPDGSMNNMSWLAFWLLLGAGTVAIAAALLSKARFGSYLLALCSLIAFVLSVYAFYPYISAAFVGIDSTWEVPFFIVILLLLAAVIVNMVAAMKALPFKGAAPKIILPVCASLLAVLLVGGRIADENAPQISGFLKTPTSVEIHTGDPNEDTQYYKSNYKTLSELMAAGREKAEEAMAEGIVLLRNENGALPLKEGERKVGFFGMSSVDPVYGGTGSGNVDTSSAPSWKTAFERNSLFTVNEDLWNWYSAPEQEVYKRTTGQTGPGVTGAKSIGEAPWDVVRSANGQNFAKYGDAAIVVISRLGGEGSDMPRGTLALSQLDDADGSQGDTVSGDYLKLSPKEQALLAGLKAEKDAGTIKKIVVLLNFANQVEADFIDNEAYGIDAALWIGTPGQVGMYAVADVLAGNVNPSGRLSATFWRTHDRNPALANFGATAYDGAADVINSDGSPQQDRYYVVYQEGIYVGYRYTESRYEDYVMNTPNTGAFDYAETVSFPFGFGKSYSAFDYSDYKVEKSGDGANTVYTVSVTVTNSGSAAGKETVQIYLKKPYGE